MADWKRLTREIEALGLQVLWINRVSGEVHCAVPMEML